MLANKKYFLNLINPNSIGGGEEKCPCSHNDKTTLMKQIYLFDAALFMTNT